MLHGRRMKLLAIAIAITFSSAGLLHALIPHNDAHTLADLKAACETLYGYGHCPGGAGIPNPEAPHEAALWNFIHAGIAHAGKQSLPTGEPLAAVASAIALSLLAARFLVRARMGNDAHERAVARGTHPSRAFG